jgi:RNA polymerase sigma-70 factor, ECF subfamily
MLCAITSGVTFGRRRGHLPTIGAKTVEPDAFVELLRPELSRLHQSAYYLARDADEARDLAQDACARAYEAFGSFRRGAPLGPWLHRILRNVFLDRRKSAAARHEVRRDVARKAGGDAGAAEPGAPPEATLGDVVATASPLEQLLHQEQREMLTEHVRALPDAFREVLVLCDIQGFDYEHVCEITGSPLGTVKSRLSRARLLLRERLLAAGELSSGQSRTAHRGVS